MSKNSQNVNKLKISEKCRKPVKNFQKTKGKYRKKCRKNHTNIDHNFEKPRRGSEKQQKCQKNDEYVKKLSKNAKNV